MRLANKYINPFIGSFCVLRRKSFWVESRDLSQTDNSYYGVFFSKVEWWVVELLFLSLNNQGLNFLQNESSQFSQIYLSPEKLNKVFTFQSCKWLFSKLSTFTKMTTIFTQIVVLSKNRCHFVNLLSFASSYIFLSLRKITWLNSQDFHLRTQNEELRCSFMYSTSEMHAQLQKLKKSYFFPVFFNVSSVTYM